MIQHAIAAAQTAYGVESLTDRFRGLHIGPDEVERLIAREPGAPVFGATRAEAEDGDESEEVDEVSRLTWLAAAYGLSQFDLDVLLIALWLQSEKARPDPPCVLCLRSEPDLSG